MGKPQSHRGGEERKKQMGIEMKHCIRYKPLYNHIPLLPSLILSVPLWLTLASLVKLRSVFL
jgi:hypothetical protein